MENSRGFWTVLLSLFVVWLSSSASLTMASHVAHFGNDRGPLLAQNENGCLTCHASGHLQCQEEGPVFADGRFLSETNVCDTCHSPGGAFDGVAMAKQNWWSGVYDASGKALQPGKELWCAGCHDGEAVGDPAYSRRTEPAVPIIVDNTEGTHTGSWTTSTYGSGYYGSDYEYHAPGSGSDTFTWTPTITEPGTYEVFAWWTEHSNRAPDATYTIYHDGGSTAVAVDQRTDGSQWVSLGIFDFDGTGDYVELSESPNGYVIADATMLEPSTRTVTVDNPDGTPTGTWTTSSWGSGYYGSDYAYHAPGSGSDTFTWTPTITEAGTYGVFAWWTEHSNRAPDATYTIYHDGGSTAVAVDQRFNGGKWVALGTFDFDGTDDYVELSESPNGYVIADAVAWDNPSAWGTYAPNVIGDDTQTYGFYVTGHGANSNTNCLDCHDAGKPHIDHEHRTYASALDNYQAGYRLAKPLKVPRPNRGSPPKIYEHLDDFALCADCHNLYEVLGEDIGDEYDASHTNFYDITPRGVKRNSHKYHIKGTGLHCDSDWDGAVKDSRDTCIICHNVHGPPNRAMIRHGELMSTYGTADKVPGMDFCYLTSPPPPVVCDTGAALDESVGSHITWESGDFYENGFCTSTCHGSKTIVRDPYLGPKVLTSKADPDPAPRDAETNVVLTAFVLDHDDDVTSVTIDLTKIGGGSGTTMYDDGDTTNHGDEVSGDGTYSCKTTIPGSVADGEKSLLVEADDPDGPTGTNYLVMTVKDPTVVDNLEGTPIGSWPTSSYTPGYYGADYQYHEPGTGSDTFAWTLPITTAATYEISARWTEHPNRAPDATYTIHHEGGSTDSVVDQTINGGAWVSLGTFEFDGVGVEKVELVQSESGYVIADAVKWELAE